MASSDGKQLKQFINPTLAKAFTHPLRGHIWVTVCEKGTASPKEIADELGLDTSEVSYHFRELKRRKLIKLFRTVRRRGFTEHIYRPCAPVLQFDDFEWMQVPPLVRSTFSGDLLRQIIDELIGALEAGSFDARNRHLSRHWMLVDEQGWDEVMEVAQNAATQVAAIQERCEKRRKKASAPAIPVSFAIAAFETAASISQRQSHAPGDE